MHGPATPWRTLAVWAALQSHINARGCTNRVSFLTPPCLCPMQDNWDLVLKLASDTTWAPSDGPVSAAGAIVRRRALELMEAVLRCRHSCVHQTIHTQSSVHGNGPMSHVYARYSRIIILVQ